LFVRTFLDPGVTPHPKFALGAVLAAREEDMKSIGTILGLALSASIAFGASAKEALVLTGDVPPGLD